MDLKLKIILGQVFNSVIRKKLDKEEMIGIRLSGGIDSAFMCYLTMTQYPDKKILPVTMYNKIRPDAVVSVNRVMEKLQELRPDCKLEEPEIGYFDTTGFVKTPEAHENFIKTGIKYNPKDIFQNWWYDSLFEKYDDKLNVFFSGETKNPPLDVQEELGLLEEFPPDRNHNKERLLSYNIDNGKMEFKPFRNMNKKEVAQWVKDLGLFETLFPVTETCELEIPNYAKYERLYKMRYIEPGVEPCRRCWPCREKYWAYGYYDFMTEE